jgi:hypothetical protein
VKFLNTDPVTTKMFNTVQDFFPSTKALLADSSVTSQKDNAGGRGDVWPNSGGSSTGTWTGYQSAGNTSLYLTGSATGAHLTLEPATSDGSQEWQLVT